MDQGPLVAEICERLERGEDLTSICRSDPKFPSYNAIRDWAENSAEVGANIARARARGFDTIALNCRKIARGDTEAGSTGDTQRDRLIVDTDLKLLAKWDPKRYGDLLRLGGPNGESLAPPVVNQFIVQPVIAVARPAALEVEPDAGA
jgi:hypothetical protein